MVRFRRAESIEIIPGVNAGMVSVIPMELECVVSHLRDLLDLIGARGGDAHDIGRVVRSTHLLVPAATLHARARQSQAIERIMTHAAIRPGDHQLSLTLIKRDFLWSMERHQVPCASVFACPIQSKSRIRCGRTKAYGAIRSARLSGVSFASASYEVIPPSRNACAKRGPIPRIRVKSSAPAGKSSASVSSALSSSASRGSTIGCISSGAPPTCDFTVTVCASSLRRDSRKNSHPTIALAPNPSPKIAALHAFLIIASTRLDALLKCLSL